jgi:hypothetical protein
LLGVVAAAAGDGLFKQMDFFGRQRADGARRHVAEANLADGDAAEFLDLMTDAGQETPYFAVAAFIENHFEDRRSLAPAFDAYMLGAGKTFGQVHTAMQLSNRFAFDLPGNLYLVNLLDTVTRMGEPVGQLSIVGDEDETFAGDIEPANWEHAGGVWGKQVDDARPAGGVASGCHDAFRLIHGKVDELRTAQRFAVDADFLFLRIDARAEFRHHLVIDFDAAFEDQLFALATTGDTGGGEDFLEAIAFKR